MSTFEAKLAATEKFLANRAKLGRLTTYQELGTVLGKKLAENGQRRIDTPVRREKVADVLKALDKKYADSGFLPSVLVSHFWDNSPGHRFFKTAVRSGLLPETAGEDEREGFVEAQRAFAQEAFANYGTKTVVPNDISELDASNEPLTEARVRQIIEEVVSESRAF